MIFVSVSDTLINNLSNFIYPFICEPEYFFLIEFMAMTQTACFHRYLLDSDFLRCSFMSMVFYSFLEKSFVFHGFVGY